MSASAPPPAYQQSPSYQAEVKAMATASTFPPVLEGIAPPPMTPARYHHLALVCRDLESSTAFYTKLGWSVTSTAESTVILSHPNNLDLHLLASDDKSRGEQGADNILMDFPTLKYPGHTHASWSVCSVPACKAFLATLGIEPSGTRSTLAIFVRDTDRTTLEFERNDGGDSPPEGGVFAPEHFGHFRPLDHVGIRVIAPYDRHLEWYARHLGFNSKVRVYEPNPDPLKNMPPWVTSSLTPEGERCDINWIINANTPESTDNILCQGGKLKAGILYPAFEILEKDSQAILQHLKAAGVDCALDVDIASGKVAWGDFPSRAVSLYEGRPSSIFVRDLNGNILRFVPSK